MPEGPELHIASRFVNNICRDRIFTGKVVKSEVSKSEDVSFEAKAYTITAASRGKEMQLILSNHGDFKNKKDSKKKKPLMTESLKILFRFGMSGKFQFTPSDEIPKHSHLRFFTNDKPPMVLSFVDVRRFGRWEVGADWSPQRGPDPMFQYQDFRTNVIKNLSNSSFNKPICEALLDQKYFNGIGNYLRAEILYRSQIPPFSKARTVLEGLPEIPPDTKVKDNMDLLHLCHVVPLEVINLKGSTGFNPDGKALDYEVFENWLQCYYQPDMNNLVDSKGRTVWFKGPAGPMAPKGAKTRGVKKSKKRKGDTDETAEEVTTKAPRIKKKVAAKPKVKPDTEVGVKGHVRLTRSKVAETLARNAAPANGGVASERKRKASQAAGTSTPAKKVIKAKTKRNQTETSAKTARLSKTPQAHTVKDSKQKKVARRKR